MRFFDTDLRFIGMNTGALQETCRQSFLRLRIIDIIRNRLYDREHKTTAKSSTSAWGHLPCSHISNSNITLVHSVPLQAWIGQSLRSYLCLLIWHIIPIYMTNMSSRKHARDAMAVDVNLVSLLWKINYSLFSSI